MVVGGYGFLLARFRTDGSLDTSFSGGTVNTNLPGLYYPTSVALQADGRLVVAGIVQSAAGDFDFGVVRYQSDGALDTSFATGGLLIHGVRDIDESAAGVAVQADGKIVVVGQATSRDYNAEIPTRIRIVRLGTNGSPDGSFGTGGTVTSTIGFSTPRPSPSAPQREDRHRRHRDDL